MESTQINQYEYLMTAKTHSNLRGYAERLTGNREDAEDLYQDTLVIGYKSVPKFLANLSTPRNQRALFYFWLRRIMGRTFYKRRKQVDAVSMDTLSIGEQDEKGLTYPPPSPVSFLSTLKGQRKRVANLLAQGVDRGDIATILGVTPQTIHWHIKAIRKDFLNFETQS